MKDICYTSSIGEIMKTAFIIHGSFGSSQENWFPWLETQLTEKGFKVFNLDYPIGYGKQNYDNWEMVLNSVKRFINEDSIFFCHSISCIFLIKYCVRNNIKIGKAILVSGFNHYLGLDEEFDDVNCTMYTNNIKEFIQLCPERICYYSKNDPYVKLEKLTDFAQQLQAQVICIDNAGHFNASAGYLQFENLLLHI